MGAIFRLSLRQLAGGRVRLAITLIAGGLPVVIAGIARAFGGPEGADDEFIQGAFGTVLIPIVLPIIAMAMGTAAFGEEIEDRTLSYLTMKPISRFRIVLAKYLAVVAVTGPILIVSGVAVALLADLSGVKPSLSIATALFAGTVAYGALFTWAGLITSRGVALGLGLMYIFLWEGVASGLLVGMRYGSVGAWTMSMMYGLDNQSFSMFEDVVIGLWAAITGVGIAAVLFIGLSLVRLRRMDVP
ncbi:MAG: ABC transporter permease subunit [Dehalococcoidia bacterium]|nr:ABC transporter permease subunit [Dehalococcoidia bacterium]